MSPFDVDWQTAFKPSVPAAELILRGSLMYLSLFGLIRFVLKREGGNIGLADLLMTVLVADAAQNGMASDYKSVTDGLILVGTLVFWNYFLDWASFRYPAVRRLVESSPLQLVEKGRMLRRNMRRELISADELLMHIRESGAHGLEEVERAFMESDGKISVIPKKK